MSNVLNLYTKIDGKEVELSAVAIVPGLMGFAKFPIYCLIGAYISEYSSKKKSTYTRKNEQTYFSDLYEFFKTKNVYHIHDVSYQVLMDYKAFMLLRVSPATVNRHFATIKNFFNVLHKTDKIQKNPCLNISLEKIEKPVINLWCARDLVRAMIGAPHLRPVLRFMWLSGARVGEVVNLRPQDVDYKNKIIWLSSHKNSGARRPIDLTTKIEKVLHSIPFQPDFVFGYRTKYANDELGKLIKEAVLNFCENKALVAKELRHTYCTRALELGVSNATVQKMMGHSSYKTTQNYEHLSRRHLRKTSEQM